jgi:hypothetical protein
MKDKEKIQLANLVLEFLSAQRETPAGTPKMVGTLNKVWGLNGFKKAEVGNPVFQKGDRYIIYLESLDGKTSVEIPFSKEILKPAIDFLTELKFE